MIVTFYGTKKSDHDAPMLLAGCAFESAYVEGNKTLILQFCNRYAIEELLQGSEWGKRTREHLLREESGMEMLFRRAKSGGIKEEHFATYSNQILTTKNGDSQLDIATVARLEDFTKELQTHPEALEKILLRAKQCYDSIFVLADGTEEKLIKGIRKHTDKTVICIDQREKEPFILGEKENTYYVIPGFDEESIFSLKSRKKSYKTQNVVGIPYNVEFYDAAYEKDLLRFFSTNQVEKEDDENGPFMSALKELSRSLFGQEKDAGERQMPRLYFSFRKRKEERDSITKTVIPEEALERPRKAWRKEKVRKQKGVEA